MNPSPNSEHPFQHPPRLVDTRLEPPGYVPVVIARGHPTTLDYLDTIERLWRPEREQLAKELLNHGERLQSRHWQWTRKFEESQNLHCLLTVECEGRIQGAMAVKNLLCPSGLTGGTHVLYVDYLEVAPWNMRVPMNPHMPEVCEPRFKGVGTLLLGEAIRMSLGPTAGGRVGLHSLPQADGFYNRCGMKWVRRDQFDSVFLSYFEYPDGVAAQQLRALGLSV